MSDLAYIPEWLGAAAISALIAALGYVGKLLVGVRQAYRDAKNARLAALVRLQSLLRVSRTAFRIQHKHAVDLSALIVARQPALASHGYDVIIAKGFLTLNEEERELHTMIRCITVNALRPTNQELLAWLGADTYFKAYAKPNKAAVCAKSLGQLESHLLLWHAKYEAWIPDHPEHALVYLNDEKQHGVEFPKGLDEAVDQLVINRGVSGW